MSVKYAIYPGPIRSANDGEWHIVGADQLMRLHGVRPDECVVIANYEDQRSGKGRGLIPLHPQNDYNPVQEGEQA